MELTSVVYSSTLIFLLLLCAFLVVGFLLLQSRKDQLNFSERKTKTRNISSLNYAPPVSADKYYPGKHHSTAAKSENNIESKYDDEESVERKKNSTKSRPGKPVSRGSLVREYYTADSFQNSKSKKNDDIVKFN